MYYKVTKPIRVRFTDPEGLERDITGFVGKAVMRFGPCGFITLKQKNGLEVDIRTDIVEEVSEFDYETAGQFKLFEEVDNE